MKLARQIHAANSRLSPKAGTVSPGVEEILASCIPPRDVTGDDENENARWRKRHAPYWGECGYADDQY